MAAPADETTPRIATTAKTGVDLVGVAELVGGPLGPAPRRPGDPTGTTVIAAGAQMSTALQSSACDPRTAAGEVSARADAPGDVLRFHPRQRLEEDTAVGEPGRLPTGTDTTIPTVAQAREPVVPRSHREVLRTTGLVVGSIGDRR
jgi:hypothetical protein